MTIRSANAPGAEKPSISSHGHWFGLPTRQASHTPQDSIPSPTTNCPRRSRWTPGPTSTTSAAYSCPHTTGVRTGPENRM